MRLKSNKQYVRNQPIEKQILIITFIIKSHKIIRYIGWQLHKWVWEAVHRSINIRICRKAIEKLFGFSLTLKLGNPFSGPWLQKGVEKAIGNPQEEGVEKGKKRSRKKRRKR